MSPFAGKGANLAILDGAELGKPICANPGDVEAALAEYEQGLFPSSASLAGQTARDHRRFFGPDTPQTVVELITGHEVRRSPTHAPRTGYQGASPLRSIWNARIGLAVGRRDG
ncbi:hypothetical protein [Roseateles agri]|uniref:hypothetical protein n=1 Tax=Roseateles agri TaxID=3098619 RepID=UPI0032AFC2A2